MILEPNTRVARVPMTLGRLVYDQRRQLNICPVLKSEYLRHNTDDPPYPRTHPLLLRETAPSGQPVLSSEIPVRDGVFLFGRGNEIAQDVPKVKGRIVGFGPRLPNIGCFKGLSSRLGPDTLGLAHIGGPESIRVTLTNLGSPHVAWSAQSLLRNPVAAHRPSILARGTSDAGASSSRSSFRRPHGRGFATSRCRPGGTYLNVRTHGASLGVMPTPTEAADAILEQLATEAVSLDAAVTKHDAAATSAITRTMNSLVSILETCWPQARLTTELGNLKRHIQFPEKFAPRAEWDRITRDPKDCQNDIAGLKKQLNAASQWVPPTLEAEVLALPHGTERDLTLEAVACLQAGANRAAIVLAGLAMESRARRIYEQATGTDSKDLSFYEVVDQLDDLEKANKITRSAVPVVDIVRLYRNFAAHPGKFVEADFVAPQIVAITTGLLKSDVTETHGATR